MNNGNDWDTVLCAIKKHTHIRLKLYLIAILCLTTTMLITLNNYEVETTSVEYQSRVGTSGNNLTVAHAELYPNDLYLVAQCVEAEAGNQGALGKAYVVDCIYNRFEQGDYNSLTDVILESGQFESVSNGMIYNTPTDETIQVCKDEWFNRTNSEIRYFRTGHYHSFGHRCFPYKDHFFSK